MGKDGNMRENKFKIEKIVKFKSGEFDGGVLQIIPTSNEMRSLIVDQIRIHIDGPLIKSFKEGQEIYLNWA